MNCGKRCFDSEDGTRLSCLLEKGHDGKHEGYPPRLTGNVKDMDWLMIEDEIRLSREILETAEQCCVEDIPAAQRILARLITQRDELKRGMNV